MPELPEVDEMVTALKQRQLIGSVLTGVLGTHVPRYLAESDAVEGISLREIWRKGKYVVLCTSAGTLLLHNKFTGYWDTSNQPWGFDYVEFKRPNIAKDIRLSFVLDDGRDHLRLHDARALATVKWFSSKHPEELTYLRQQGPDWIETPNTHPAFLPKTFKHLIDRFLNGCATKKPIKQVLLDQGVLAGVGNIYACELLWRRKIRPNTPSETLSDDSLLALMSEARMLLMESIEAKINYEQILKIFRAKECPRCRGAVTRTEESGRGTYWCEKCQTG